MPYSNNSICINDKILSVHVSTVYCVETVENLSLPQSEYSKNMGEYNRNRNWLTQLENPACPGVSTPKTWASTTETETSGVPVLVGKFFC